MLSFSEKVRHPCQFFIHLASLIKGTLCGKYCVRMLGQGWQILVPEPPLANYSHGRHHQQWNWCRSHSFGVFLARICWLIIVRDHMEVNKVTDGWDREMNKFERYQRNGRDGTASVTECWLGMKSCWAKSRMASRFLTWSAWWMVI